MLSISDGPAYDAETGAGPARGDGEKRVPSSRFTSPARSASYFVNIDAFPRFQMLRVTKSDGDGKITAADQDYYWDTAGYDENGKRWWPDGLYNVNVYAWDIGGNRAVSRRDGAGEEPVAEFRRSADGGVGGQGWDGRAAVRWPRRRAAMPRTMKALVKTRPGPGVKPGGSAGPGAGN